MCLIVSERLIYLVVVFRLDNTSVLAHACPIHEWQAMHVHIAPLQHFLGWVFVFPVLASLWQPCPACLSSSCRLSATWILMRCMALLLTYAYMNAHVTSRRPRQWITYMREHFVNWINCFREIGRCMLLWTLTRLHPLLNSMSREAHHRSQVTEHSHISVIQRSLRW